ncbi:ATP-binding protein [Jannaschia sp. R86511]|uniref:ATP-binding protein n=1 Tax=Jannaschia sp. R86511 TaxID=3093853 RepID=UPI0036D2CB8F
MVIAAHEQRLALAPDLSAVRTARSFLRSCCADLALPEQLVGTAALLTSELVSNAVRHAGSGARLTVTSLPGGVRVEVADTSPVRPTASMPAPEADHGRGLMFVDLMATRWGVREDEPGKVVWFELVAG